VSVSLFSGDSKSPKNLNYNTVLGRMNMEWREREGREMTTTALSFIMFVYVFFDASVHGKVYSIYKQPIIGET
jgi:hypothetical protein